jgi:hypothetical protein
MIEVKDRIPTYPGRVRLIPVSGQANTFDMVRADEAIELGTPINKALFDSIVADLAALQKSINDSLFALTQRVALSTRAVGDEIGLYENGVLTPFILVMKNYEGTGRNLVVRKNCFSTEPMMSAGEYFYENCKVDRWLNEEYITYLDGVTQTALANITINSGDAYGFKDLSRKAFLLSTSEYGLVPVSSRYEGSTVPYFSDGNERRIARYQGTPVKHYTRTIDSSAGVDDVNVISADGSSVVMEKNPTTTTTVGIRPAFTLPNSLQVTIGVPENTMANAEVI